MELNLTDIVKSDGSEKRFGERISLEPCNLGLEQIEENQLNLQEVFPAHSPSVTTQIPCCHLPFHLLRF